MFCQSCLTCIRAAIQDLYSTYPHAWGSKILHKSLSEFHQSVVAQCWFCRQLWTSLLEKEAACVTEDDDSTQAMDQFSILSERWEKSCIQLGVSVKDSYLKLDLCIFQYPTAEFGLRRFKSFILSPKPHNIEVLRSYLGEEIFANDGSGIRNASMWRQWFRTCSESHKRCRALDQKSKNFLPDRLLKVSTNDGGKSFNWKLVLSTGLEDTSYITLSHCWGASQHEILTKGNFDDRMKPTSSSKLPKSFQHAFYIAFKLGFRFIWIDSLCIIQKDEADWLTQASMMGSIYENASCNIAATWAKDGDGGCFTTSEDRSILLNFPFGKTWEYQADDYRFYYDDILEAPLNRRGWVTQERYLAKRQLNFAKSGVYWECRELIASELYPCGIPKTLRDMSPYNQARPPEGSPTLDYPDTMQRRRAWAGLVDFYSNCAFTNISDKMIALAGLARQMSLMEEDTYLAGLWKKDIQSQLCWTIENDVRRKDDWSRISPYLAPTWSWASIDGPVRSDQRYYLENVKYESLVKVLDISIQSEHESKLHRFTRSSLTLQGIAVWARPKSSKCGIPSNHEGGWILQCTDLQSDGSTTEISVHIVWDEYWSESSANMKKRASILSQRDSDLLCLLVHYNIDDAEFVGLLLRQHRFPADEVSYTRMGIFTTNGENPLGMLSARLNYISSYPIVRGINLHSTNLSRFVHTAVIF